MAPLGPQATRLLPVSNFFLFSFLIYILIYIIGFKLAEGCSERGLAVAAERVMC